MRRVEKLTIAILGGVVLALLTAGPAIDGMPTSTRRMPPVETTPPGPVEEQPLTDAEHRALGRYDLRPLLARIPDAPLVELYPDEATIALAHLRDEEEEFWVSGRKYDRVEKLVETCIAHRDRLQSDREYRDFYTWKTWMRVHPVFGDYEQTARRASPWVISTVISRLRQIRPDAQQVVARTADRYARILSRFHSEVRRILGEKLDLPVVADSTQADVRTLKLVVFPDARSFERYQKTIRRQLPPGTNAEYNHIDQIAIVTARDYLKKRTPQNDRAVVIYVATHQLLHAWRKLLLEQEVGEEILWTDKRLRADRIWIDAGLVRLFTTTTDASDEEFELLDVSRQMLELWRDFQGEEFSLTEMLRINNRGVMRRLAAEKGGIARASATANIFFIQAWAFTHFLWHHEGGVYRERYLEFLQTQLTCRVQETFEEVFWGDMKHDPAVLEAEFRGYVDRLMKEQGLK